jgi:hypothetical protein
MGHLDSMLERTKDTVAQQSAADALMTLLLRQLDDVETQYSHDHVPIHESLLEVARLERTAPADRRGMDVPESGVSSKLYFSTEI